MEEPSKVLIDFRSLGFFIFCEMCGDTSCREKHRRHQQEREEKSDNGEHLGCRMRSNDYELSCIKCRSVEVTGLNWSVLLTKTRILLRQGYKGICGVWSRFM